MTPDQKKEEIAGILEMSATFDLPISRCLPKIAKRFKKDYGIALNKPWFSVNVRLFPDMLDRWVEITKFRAMLLNDEQDDVENEFAARIFKTTPVKDGEGNVIGQQPSLSMQDIAAFRAIDQTRRKRIASMMPKLYAPDEEEKRPPVELNINLKKG